MKTTIRRHDERGLADHGWLKSAHTFSFADYHDDAHMGFRSLRVINDDRVAAARGFGTHGHRDMEIISYVLEGELGHRDSMGNGSVIRRGDVQRMSAGRGVMHSEMNPSPDQAAHFLQIWIMPGQRGLTPSYEQKFFSDEDKLDRLRVVASPDGRDGSVTVHQDVTLSAGIVSSGHSVTHEVRPGRHLWLHVAEGEVVVDGQTLVEGDALSTSESGTLAISSTSRGHVLVFDLA